VAGFQKAIRGILANLDQGIALAFQFNPTSITIKKSSNYEIEEIPGWEAPTVTWKSGGIQRIEFDLLFDESVTETGPFQLTTNINGASLLRNLPANIPFIGTEGYKAVIESFMRPRRAFKQLTGDTSSFTAPPEGLLVLGPRFWSVVLDGEVAFQDVLFDLVLTPRRTTTKLSFAVLEEGDLNALNVARRNALAKGQTALSGANAILDVFVPMP
jgi:hypothetical protein